MWIVKSQNDPNIGMVEGDYGIRLPIEVTGATFGAVDSVDFVIKATPDGEDIVTKTYDALDIVANTIPLELTAEESALLPKGVYVYRLDWYQAGHFMCNLVPKATFKVVDKA